MSITFGPSRVWEGGDDGNVEGRKLEARHKGEKEGEGLGLDHSGGEGEKVEEAMDTPWEDEKGDKLVGGA